MPEQSDAYWARRGKEQREKMEQSIKNGQAPGAHTLPRLSSFYNDKRAEEVKAQKEQRAAQTANPPAFVEQMRLPPQDPRSIARKQKIINGE